MSKHEKVVMTRKEFEEEVIKKARSDRQFMEALVEDPKTAFGQLGVTLPEKLEIKVVEESANVMYLVLPANPDEIADEQLDEVSGGRICEICLRYCPGQGCAYFNPFK